VQVFDPLLLQAEFLGGLVIAFLVTALLFTLVWLGLAYWTDKDAEKRGNDDAVLWAVVVAVFGLFGLVPYLIVRD